MFAESSVSGPFPTEFSLDIPPHVGPDRLSTARGIVRSNSDACSPYGIVVRKSTEELLKLIFVSMTRGRGRDGTLSGAE